MSAKHKGAFSRDIALDKPLQAEQQHRLHEQSNTGVDVFGGPSVLGISAASLLCSGLPVPEKSFPWRLEFDLRPRVGDAMLSLKTLLWNQTRTSANPRQH